MYLLRQVNSGAFCFEMPHTTQFCIVTRAPHLSGLMSRRLSEQLAATQMGRFVMPKVHCHHCKKEFYRKPCLVKERNFCCRKCKDEWWKGYRFAKVLALECDYCGKTLFRPESEAKRHNYHFCSQECFGKHLEKKVTFYCAYCEKPVTKQPSQFLPDGNKFCSHACKGLWQSENVVGEAHHSWRGGTSFEPYGPEFNRSLKRDIRERDRRTCAVCHRKPAKQIHHINYAKTNNDPSNLITLCRSCHGKTNGGDENRRKWQTRFTQMMEDKYAVHE